MLVERANFNIKGIVDFYIQRGANLILESSHNLVVDSSKEIVRDLLAGTISDGATAAPFITHLAMGDMNLSLEDATANVPTAVVTDKTLVNPTAWIPRVDTQFPDNETIFTKTDQELSVQFVFSIGTQQALTASGFFCEFGLAIDHNKYPDRYLVTKLNRPPLVKTSDDKIVVKYKLVF